MVRRCCLVPRWGHPITPRRSVRLCLNRSTVSTPRGHSHQNIRPPQTRDVKQMPDSTGAAASYHCTSELTLPGVYLCAWVDFDFAFGFCGVPSTRTTGPFTCAWVVVVVEQLLADASASAFTGGTLAPSPRRPLNTLDMLTSRWKTRRGLDSVRRNPASCSRETDSERERDCTASLVAFACELLLKSFVGRSGSWAGLLSFSTSVSESEPSDDVHCGIRKSFLRKCLY